MIRAFALLTVVSTACGSHNSESTSPNVFESPGPYPVANSTFTVVDTVHGRTLTTEVWYPAAASAQSAATAGEPIQDFIQDPTQQAQFVGFLATAPNPGTRRQTSSARDVPMATIKGLLPLIAFSHCDDCFRFSCFTVSERLASFGFVVVAPDHEDNTLFDEIAGTAAGVDAAFLETRRQDISAVLDAVLETSGSPLPTQLQGKLDATRIGMYGHSYGAATTGLALKEEPRLKAGFALATPLANPLFPSVTMADITVPAAMMEMQEDNSIGIVGNTFIEGDYMDATAPIWLGEIMNAEHWSVSDICGLDGNFPAGCTPPAIRQTNGQTFTDIDINESRGIAAAYVTAFFAKELQNDSRGAAYLKESRPAGVTTMQARNVANSP